MSDVSVWQNVEEVEDMIQRSVIAVGGGPIGPISFAGFRS